MPHALMCGLSYQEFWKTNPHIINLLLKNRRQRDIYYDELMHTFGYYIQSAVANAIGGCFGGAKHKNTYPKEPFFKKAYEDSLLTEDEKYERDLRAALAAEEAWIIHDKMRGLPETKC